MNASVTASARCALAALASSIALSTPVKSAAESFEVLHRWGGAHGVEPMGSLAFDGQADLYGTTRYSGGEGTYGTVFKLSNTTDYREISYLHYFHGARDGSYPGGSIVVGSEGTLFGTSEGGKSAYGVVYEVDPTSGFQRLLDMPAGGSVGAPTYGLVPGPGGMLYGATNNGGNPICYCGTLFSFEPATGRVRVLHVFDYAMEGGPPQGQVSYSNGKLYGTTNFYPFAFDLASSAMTLYGPKLANGGFEAGLTVARNGVVWGVIARDAAHGNGNIIRLDDDGTYEIVATLGSAVGHFPNSALLESSDGLLYGTTAYGGLCDFCGAVYKFDPAANIVEPLHLFEPGNKKGMAPAWRSGLVEDKLGRIYGATVYTGQMQGGGLVYRITP